jgi:hypothetical protein
MQLQSPLAVIPYAGHAWTQCWLGRAGIASARNAEVVSMPIRSFETFTIELLTRTKWCARCRQQSLQSSTIAHQRFSSSADGALVTKRDYQNLKSMKFLFPTI